MPATVARRGVTRPARPGLPPGGRLGCPRPRPAPRGPWCVPRPWRGRAPGPGHLAAGVGPAGGRRLAGVHQRRSSAGEGPSRRKNTTRTGRLRQGGRNKRPRATEGSCWPASFYTLPTRVPQAPSLRRAPTPATRARTTPPADRRRVCEVPPAATAPTGRAGSLAGPCRTVAGAPGGRIVPVYRLERARGAPVQDGKAKTRDRLRRERRRLALLRRSRELLPLDEFSAAKGHRRRRSRLGRSPRSAMAGTIRWPAQSLTSRDAFRPPLQGDNCHQPRERAGRDRYFTVTARAGHGRQGRASPAGRTRAGSGLTRCRRPLTVGRRPVPCRSAAGAAGSRIVPGLPPCNAREARAG